MLDELWEERRMEKGGEAGSFGNSRSGLAPR